MKLPQLFTALLATAALSATAAADIVFLDGVGISGGWHDVNKRSMWFENGNKAVYDNGVSRKADTDAASFQAYYYGSYGDFKMSECYDSSMCWAASAANTLQWWQDRRAEHHEGQLPAGTPNGKAETAQYTKLQHAAQLSIYQVLYTNFRAPRYTGSSTLAGIPGKTYAGWEWWFNGYTENVAAMAGGSTLAASSGSGYWKDLGYYTRFTQQGSGYVNESTLFSVSFPNTSNYEAALTDPIRANQAVSLTVTGGGNYINSGHAVTMWGYEKEGDKLYIYLTDSDDYYHGLVKYLVTATDEGVMLSTTDSHNGIVDEGGTHMFSTLDGFRIDEVYALVAPYAVSAGIPEPATTSLLLLGTALLARRRRR